MISKDHKRREPGKQRITNPLVIRHSSLSSHKYIQIYIGNPLSIRALCDQIIIYYSLRRQHTTILFFAPFQSPAYLRNPIFPSASRDDHGNTQPPARPPSATTAL